MQFTLLSFMDFLFTNLLDEKNGTFLFLGLVIQTQRKIICRGWGSNDTVKEKKDTCLLQMSFLFCMQLYAEKIVPLKRFYKLKRQTILFHRSQTDFLCLKVFRNISQIFASLSDNF